MKIKTLMSVLIFVCLTAFMLPALSVKGDVNRDGTINIVDAMLIAMGPEIRIDYAAADVNCDGQMNIYDSLIIARYSAGLTKLCRNNFTITYSYTGGLAGFNDITTISLPSKTLTFTSRNQDPVTYTLTETQLDSINACCIGIPNGTLITHTCCDFIYGEIRIADGADFVDFKWEEGLEGVPTSVFNLERIIQTVHTIVSTTPLAPDTLN